MSCRFKLGVVSWKRPERKLEAFALEDDNHKIVLVCPCIHTTYKLVKKPGSYYLNHIYSDVADD